MLSCYRCNHALFWLGDEQGRAQKLYWGDLLFHDKDKNLVYTRGGTVLNRDFLTGARNLGLVVVATDVPNPLPAWVPRTFRGQFLQQLELQLPVGLVIVQAFLAGSEPGLKTLAQVLLPADGEYLNCKGLDPLAVVAHVDCALLREDPPSEFLLYDPGPLLQREATLLGEIAKRGNVTVWALQPRGDRVYPNSYHARVTFNAAPGNPAKIWLGRDYVDDPGRHPGCTLHLPWGSE